MKAPPVLALLLTLPAVALAQGGPGQVFHPIADAKVSEAAPGSNQGFTADLRVQRASGSSFRSYLRFDLSGRTRPVIAAKLRLFCTDGSATGGKLYALPDSGWTEAGLTWSNQPGAPAYLLTQLGSVAANAWREVDVTSAVRAGTTVFVLGGGSGDAAVYSSREGAHRPEIVITPGLTVSPGAFAAGGPEGGPFAPASQSLQLGNPGQSSIPWVAASDVPWLGVSPTGGTIPANGQQALTASLQNARALDTGRYTGRVTFRHAATNAVLATAEATLGIGTTIEAQAWLNVHGRRFFPIGVWNQPPWPDHVTYLRGLGINTYLNNGLGPPEPTNPQLLDLLAANDMWAVLQFDPAVKDHPRLLGWLMGDEPDISSTPVSVVRQAYDGIRAADDDHFIALNTSGGFYWDANFGSPTVESLYQGYTSIPEIASFDMYPVGGWNQPSWVYMPGAMTAFLQSRYVDHAKPVWAILEASDPDLSWTPPDTRGPTPAQMRFQAFDAILHGATAIHYFTIAFNPFRWSNLTREIEQELARTNGQITALADVILSAPQALSVSSTASGGLAHNKMLRRRGSAYFVFADNADMGYRSATITFTFPRPILSVAVHAEGRTIVPSGNSFSDAFAPLAVHVYEVRLIDP